MSYIVQRNRFIAPRFVPRTSGRGVGYIIDAAGIRVTTRNDTLDAAIKWGFWGTMAYLFYRMAKVAMTPFREEYGV